MSLLESLRRGWWSGWAEFPELVAGGAGLLESLIPGDRPDDPLERLKEWGNEAAQGARLEGGGGRSEGLLEKVAEGLGAAPGTLASMAPFMYGGGAVAGGARGAAALGGRILGPSLGFGAHSLIRHGDEGLPTAIGHGLRGAAEGAIFGGIGAKAGSALVPEAAKPLISKIKYLEGLAQGGNRAAARLATRLNKQLADTGIDTAGRQFGRRALHGAGAGGVVGGMTLLHGGDVEDAVASGATMGLLGMLSHGKYRTPGITKEEMLGAVEKDIRRAAERRELRPLEASEKTEAMLPEGEQPSLTDVARTAKPYDSPQRTLASREQFEKLEPENQKLMLEQQNKDLPFPLERYQEVAITPGQVFELQSRMVEIQNQKALLKQHMAHAKKSGDNDLYQSLLEREAELGLVEAAQFEPMSGSQTQAGRALVNIRWARRNEPEWVEAVKSFERQFGKEHSKRFKELAMLSEGDPRLLQKLTSVVNRPKMWDYMMEYWINGLLSGPTTQAVNISSNALRQGIDYYEKKAGLLAESKLGDSKLTAADRGAIMGADRSAAWAAIKMFPQFYRAALSEAKRMELIESDPRMKMYAERSKLDHPTAAIPGKPGSFIRIPGNMLQVMDLYFKGIAGQRAASYTATRKAYEMFRNKEIKETEIEGKIAEFLGERPPSPKFEAAYRVSDTGRIIKTGQMHEWPVKESTETFNKSEAGFWDHATDKFYTRKEALDRVNLETPISKKAVDGRGLDMVDVAYGKITGKGLAEPAQFILDAMKKEAEIQTFTERITHPAGKLVSGLRDVPVRVPILGIEAKPGTLVVPFWQTPWNVVTQSIARSPLGLLRMKSLKQRYENKEITPQEYYKEVAGTVMGTTVWASLLTFAKMGGLTGGGPTNYADRQNLLATGWRPYSIKLGDTYLQMQRLEPFGTVLGLAADAAEFGASDDKTGRAIAIVKDNLTDKSFLYGLESFAKAFANPEQFGSTYYRQMAGSIVPTFFSKAAQAVDPYQRIQEPLGARAGVPDALAYRLPGVSRALPIRTNAMGEKAERWGVMSTDTPLMRGLSGVQSMLSPLPISAERLGTEVEKELDRLRGYQGTPPSSPRRTKKMVLKGVTGENVKLTDDEYAVYDRYHQRAKQHMAQMISSPQWGRIPDPMKAKMLDKVYKKYRNAASKEITVMVRRRTSVGN